MPTSCERLVYSMSDMGDASERTNGDSRWAGQERLSTAVSWSLCQGTPIGDSIGVIEADMWAPGPVEDMPWIGNNRYHVMSTRLRNLLDTLAPAHAEFLPVRLFYKKKVAFDVGSYWAANWLHLVDCFSREHSEWEHSDDFADGVNITELVVDPPMVPASILVWRVKHWNNKVIVRQCVKEAIERSGMTGVQFYSVGQA